MLDASANETLLDKSPEEAFDILDRVASNDYQFPTTGLGAGRRAPGMLDLDANDLVSAQLSAITHMLKNLQKPTDVRDAKALSCVHCEGKHHANDCPTMHESASYVGNYNRNANNPHSNTYNPGWRQHPNFSWGNQGGGNTSNANRQQNVNAPPGFQTNMPWQSEAKGNASTSHNNSMEGMMQEFISSTKTLLHDHSTTIKNQGNLLQTQGALLQRHGSSLRALENQVGQIAQALQAIPQGSLPSDTEVTRRNGKEECSALTLRSGTTINKNVKPRGDENTEASAVTRQEESEVPEETEAQEEEGRKEGREEVLTTNPSRGQTPDAAARPVPIQETEEVRPPPLFPQRLKKHKEDNQFKRFVDMLDQISDFGLATSFGKKETIANTKREVGTLYFFPTVVNGYMYQEHAIDGPLYSIKSDVYSFRVLVLENVSGKKNRGFSHPDHQHNLVGHVSLLIFLCRFQRFKCYGSGSRSISTMQRSETTKIAWTLFGDEKSMELVAGQIKETCYLLSMVGRIVRP
ncbi:hypothetical protein GQ457_02G029850 [Hibiscus cannabinus]